MPYATCPICKSAFHLRVAENIDSWHERFPVSDDGVRYIHCFGCWKDLKEFDVVEVLEVPEHLQSFVSRGDIGTIIMVHNAHEFEVESVNESCQWPFILTHLWPIKLTHPS